MTHALGLVLALSGCLLLVFSPHAAVLLSLAAVACYGADVTVIRAHLRWKCEPRHAPNRDTTRTCLPAEGDGGADP